MHVKAQRWGNSLAVRIPKAVAAEVGIREQDEMEIEVAGGMIQLRPLSESQPGGAPRRCDTGESSWRGGSRRTGWG